MTKSDIEKIMYDRCLAFGYEVYLPGSMQYQSQESQEERIVILVGKTRPSRYWEETDVRINWCVPDINDEKSASCDLAEDALKSLYYGIGEFEGKVFRYKKDSTDTSEDKDNKCHVANLTLRFQYQNTK